MICIPTVSWGCEPSCLAVIVLVVCPLPGGPSGNTESVNLSWRDLERSKIRGLWILLLINNSYSTHWLSLGKNHAQSSVWLSALSGHLEPRAATGNTVELRRPVQRLTGPAWWTVPWKWRGTATSTICQCGGLKPAPHSGGAARVVGR